MREIQKQLVSYRILIMPGKYKLIIGGNKYFTDFSTFDMSSGEIKNINVRLSQNYDYFYITNCYSLFKKRRE